jgi:hypothetical protein
VDPIRYAAAACQTDLPNPIGRLEMKGNTDRILSMIDSAVGGSAPFLPVRLVVFPEFAHAAPVYVALAELRDKLAVEVPNEHTERLHAKAKEYGIWIQSGSMLEEDARFPDVIIELLSDSTRGVDKGEKKTLYERVFHTGEYYLYDPFSQEFVGYHLQGPHPHYEEVKPDAAGKIYSPTMGLYLVVQNEWLRWMTSEGAVLPSPMELAEPCRILAAGNVKLRWIRPGSIKLHSWVMTCKEFTDSTKFVSNRLDG